MTNRQILANYRHILEHWEQEYHLGARTFAILSLIDAGVGIVEAEQAVDAVGELVRYRRAA